MPNKNERKIEQFHTDYLMWQWIAAVGNNGSKETSKLLKVDIVEYYSTLCWKQQ